MLLRVSGRYDLSGVNCIVKNREKAVYIGTTNNHILLFFILCKLACKTGTTRAKKLNLSIYFSFSRDSAIVSPSTSTELSTHFRAFFIAY